MFRGALHVRLTGLDDIHCGWSGGAELIHPPQPLPPQGSVDRLLGSLGVQLPLPAHGQVCGLHVLPFQRACAGWVLDALQLECTAKSLAWGQPFRKIVHFTFMQAASAA